MEFGSAVLNAISGFYSASDEETLSAKASDIRAKFEQIEVELSTGPYFAGERFTMVDAVFGPVFRYFDVFEQFEDFGFFARTPRVRAWREALAARASASVQGAPTRATRHRCARSCWHARARCRTTSVPALPLDDCPPSGTSQ